MYTQHRTPFFIRIGLPLLICLSILTACNSVPQNEVHERFRKYYDHYGVQGSFILYDPVSDQYTYYNPDQQDQPFTPASTFKICNTLIGLETGVIPDENYTMAWDSVNRNVYWDRDHDLWSAFKYSVVWYYQELARRVGEDRMKKWLEQAEYGNQDISGGIDLFWLTGGLRITPRQQIEFLQQVHNNDLPFSQRSLDMLKDIMIERQTESYVLRGKTGWGTQEELNIGWFVGYVESNEQVYYFTNCVQLPEEDLEADPSMADNFNFCRRAITDSILLELQIIDSVPK